MSELMEKYEKEQLENLEKKTFLSKIKTIPYLNISEYFRNILVLFGLGSIVLINSFGKDKFVMIIVLWIALILFLNMFLFSYFHYRKTILNSKKLIVSQFLVIVGAYLILDTFISKIFSNEYFSLFKYLMQ